MKRFAHIAIAAMVAGVVLHFAIAWACAIWKPAGHHIGPATLSARESQWIRDGAEQRPPEGYVERYSSLGYSSVHIELASISGDRWLAITQAWRQQGIPIPEHWSHPSQASQLRAGWPMLSFYGEEWFYSVDESSAQLSVPPPAEQRVSRKWCLLAPPAWSRHDPSGLPQPLPLLPIPLGFAVNSLFFTALMLVTFAAPRTIRAAKRRFSGQCLSCGYPLRSASACPECGARRGAA